ncbi:PREDICTED: tumor necrosis factor receptor superfamily member 6 [Gekko japonicus]|uniref:Tumor necrosis factor receptor superfamily member 6 n=1 Tax=Gekko japonicus TaxID=146911 RepID=A0ABM1L2B5_GEKJA|nr:PREDICTED: tumor necrosis factor receptor superfamily member 6 [Gekko japonicus]
MAFLRGVSPFTFVRLPTASWPGSNMRRPLLLVVSLLALLPALELIAAGPSRVNDSDPVIHRVHNKFSEVKNISKRDVVCPSGKHRSGDTCCDLCEPGYVKDKNCTTSTKTICKKCKEGKEYMDDYNYLSKCIRCSFCDPEHGFEVDKPCNSSQNVKCRCRHGFFCNSSEPCRHCDPCSKCENGIVVEECNQTSDTICGRKQYLLWIIGVVILLVLIVVAVIIRWKYRHKGNWMPKKQINDEQRPVELKPLIYPDIDLTPHISDIAEEMTLAQVKKFVRKQGLSNPTVDRIISENMHDATEQKIKLLDSWYQEKGIKGAYRTLISSLRDLKERVLADLIEQKMACHIQNNASAHQNMNADV